MPPVRDNTARALPDVASDPRPALAGALDWVGMGRIEMPVTLADGAGRVATAPARVDAFVNLARPDARGIHMSRLYLHVDAALSAEPVTPASLRRLLKDFLESHAGLSDRAMLRIGFEHLLRRPALASDHSGWRSYPVTLTAVLDRGQFALELGVQVQYSSTCPASAALSRPEPDVLRRCRPPHPRRAGRRRAHRRFPRAGLASREPASARCGRRGGQGRGRRLHGAAGRNGAVKRKGR